MNKLKTKEEIREISEKLRAEGKKIVTTNGSFDILHLAHINLLEKAKKQGDVLIVLINSDDSIKRFKGDKRPIVPQNERARVISAIEYVDYVVIFSEDKPLDTLEIIKPKIHVKGGSYVAERVKEEEELLTGWGGKQVFFDLEAGISTTNIINKILEVYEKNF